MGKYFVTQIKKLWRLLPIAFLVMALLFGSIYLIYQKMISDWSQGSAFKKLDIGVVGVLDDRLLKSGLDAIRTMDDSNLTLNLIEMDEQTARTKLESGAIAAYAVFPDDFMAKALQGEIEPLQFVSAAGSTDVISLVKDEFTMALAKILLSSECGSFGLADALAAYGYDASFQNEHMNKLALEYVSFVLQRKTMYTVVEVGVSDGLRFDQYLICGFSVLFVFLMTLPFATVFIRQDLAMERLLKSKGVGVMSQSVSELSAYALFLLILSGMVMPFMGNVSVAGVLRLIPVVFCVASISYLIYSICRDLISGVLLQMLMAVGLCFVSGCIYPVSFFPIAFQKIAKLLPPAVAREHMAGLLLEKSGVRSGMMLIGTGCVCFLVSVLLRYLRLSGRRENRQ